MVAYILSFCHPEVDAAIPLDVVVEVEPDRVTQSIVDDVPHLKYIPNAGSVAYATLIDGSNPISMFAEEVELGYSLKFTVVSNVIAPP